MRPAPPDSFTSGAPGRRCSTGPSRVATRGSSCCGWRTRTWSAPPRRPRRNSSRGWNGSASRGTRAPTTRASGAIDIHEELELENDELDELEENAESQEDDDEHEEKLLEQLDEKELEQLELELNEELDEELQDEELQDEELEEEKDDELEQDEELEQD